MRSFILMAALAWGNCVLAVAPNEAFERLIEGNQRFIDGKLLHPNRDEERRSAIAATQKPFAIVVSCSDSRVAPEIIFDEGLGDLFVIRVAGNVIGKIELESLLYSALYLDSSLLLVLGHENCGAVSAVAKGQTQDIPAIAKLIDPAIKESRTQAGNQLENAIKDNVLNIVAQMQAVPALAPLIKKKQFAIVGGYYQLASGKVQILTPSPK